MAIPCLFEQFRSIWVGAQIGDWLRQQPPQVGGVFSEPLLPLTFDPLLPWEMLARMVDSITLGQVSWLRDNQQVMQQQQCVEGIVLPLTLFYHDQPSTLSDQCTYFLRNIGATALQISAALVLAQAIAQALQAPVQSATFLVQLNDRLSAQSARSSDFNHLLSNHLLTGLQQLQPAAAHGWGLALAAHTWQGLPQSMQALARALYCFLTTPDNFYLTVLRANHAEPGSAAAIMAAMLAGTQNSISAMPRSWRLATPIDPENPAPLADRLFAYWCGLDRLAPMTASSLSFRTIATAGRLKPRQYNLPT